MNPSKNQQGNLFPCTRMLLIQPSLTLKITFIYNLNIKYLFCKIKFGCYVMLCYVMLYYVMFNTMKLINICKAF